MPLQSRTGGRRAWWTSGRPFVWLNALAVALCLSAVVGLLTLLAVRGLANFWPSPVVEFELVANGQVERVIGELLEREVVAVHVHSHDAPTEVERWLIKTGNRRVNAPDFRWVEAPDIPAPTRPEDLVVLERTEWGHAYGRLRALYQGGILIAQDEDIWDALVPRLARVEELRKSAREAQARGVNAINQALEDLRLERRRREIEGLPPSFELLAEERALRAEYFAESERLSALDVEIQRDAIELEIMTGETVRLSLASLLRVWRPNAMDWRDKLTHYLVGVGLFLSQGPREANTEGGVFPAIFGTVMMVMLMSLIVTPFGVLAAVYLREYAHQGFLVRMIRIAVNNLAGVPSIVYGVFGLGFFVYFIGGAIDDAFHAEAKPTPTFGTPGLLWASLTLALLTAPVVIVATEEGLTRIPGSIREGSLALGATRAETLFRVLLPIASPSILTGVILAVARAAGEVAPLMLVGVVKLAPALPVDGDFPFVHLERKFMHLGFHIFDVGFQSPNVEAARPLVFATAFLLVAIILLLNLTAIMLRHRLENRFSRGGYE